MHSARTIVMWMATIALLIVGSARATELTPARSGSVEFLPADTEASVPERFQLSRHSFDFQQMPVATTARNLRMSKVTFPSPVVTPHEANNTVHCEYFCPVDAQGAPGVIVLHIMGGDFDLSRLFCRALASKGVAALFLKMPYYGERRQPGSPARMVSLDPHETVQGMTQAVLDVRQAAAWLGAQQEVDREQLGIMGISLGGITSALAAGVEPRFHKACLILAGGDMGEVAWTSEELEPLRKHWLEKGGSKESLFAALAPVDPIRYARPDPARQILMLNASQDEVVPPVCTVALWKAFGEPPIIWWEAGHYSAMRYIFDGMAKTVEFFRPGGNAPKSAGKPPA